MNPKVTTEDYPLMQHKKDKIFTPGGKNIADITFETILDGSITAEDCRTSKTSLLAQADIAEDAGNIHLANNFRRAAEMVDIDSDTILKIYNALRPYRSTDEELLRIVDELEQVHQATITAAFVDHARRVLKARKKLKGDR